jgi:hypothetical protein
MLLQRYGFYDFFQGQLADPDVFQGIVREKMGGDGTPLSTWRKN